MTEAPKLKKCPACNGRGYHRCDCWPADCICGWARSLRDQCVAAGVPFLFKQWGEWAPGDLPSELQESEEIAGRWNGSSHRVGKRAAGRKLDGVEWSQFPAVAT